MKQTFSGWYPRTTEELSTLWDKALFVPDTNILLHLLRHSPHVREELLRILELLEESLWIPYQVGLEFHRKRLNVEGTAADAYDRLMKDYDSILGQAREKLRQLRAHPSIDVEKEIAAIEMFLSDFNGRMQEAKDKHPAEALSAALQRITILFEGRVGAKPTTEKMAALRKEGEERYAKHIPPGYKDAKKVGPETDKFGDLLIWKDLIEKAKAGNRPLIFITDDVKEDWWHMHRGRKLGPRPELIEEFRALTGQDFHIYELGQFLRIAAERHREIAPESVERIEKSIQEDDQARRRTENAREERELRVRFLELENERDGIISELAGVPNLDRTQWRPAADKVSMRSRLVEIEREITAALSKLGSTEGSVFDQDSSSTAPVDRPAS